MSSQFFIHLSISFFALLFFITPTFSDAKSKVALQRAVVQTDGAAVYEYPNFDSPVITYLPAGAKVISTKDSRKGIGGFGLFFRIKFGPNKFGYIADIDLITEKKMDPDRKKKVDNPDFEDALEEVDSPDGPRPSLYYSRFIGINIARADFVEEFQGTTLQAPSVLVGVRSTGPGTLFDGPPLDAGFLIHLGAPEYYNEFSSTAPTGFFFLSDLLIQLPLIDSKHSSIYYALGIMGVYTNFKLQVSNTPVDSQEFRFGGAAGFGGAMRFDKYVLRLGAKYYYEVTQYFSYNLAIQMEY